MAIVTNNITLGTIDGMGKGTGSGLVPAGITNIGQGNPDEIVTVQTGSDIYYDVANSAVYGADTGVGGSEWKQLV